MLRLSDCPNGVRPEVGGGVTNNLKNIVLFSFRKIDSIPRLGGASSLNFNPHPPLSSLNAPSTLLLPLAGSGGLKSEDC